MPGRLFWLFVFVASLAGLIVGCGSADNLAVPTIIPTSENDGGSTRIISVPTVVALDPKIEITPEITAVITADQEKATRDAEFEAQRARGWPTPEGFVPTPTLSNPPRDESSWTYVEPGECDLSTTVRVGELEQLRQDMFAFISYSWAQDEAELVEIADLIIHAVPVGKIQVRPPRFSRDMTTYYQDVQILSVIKGEAPGDTIPVVQISFEWPTQSEYLEKYRMVLGSGEDYGYPGPLQQCPQVLFLQASLGEHYSSVGLMQGVLPFDSEGHVDSVRHFESFLGLDLPQIIEKVDQLSQP
ncbi:MAG: hypothetical protein H8E48_02500 [Chloroflexi bacterium]|nr:hypothetical protein [Chloroflexota bacterium]